MENFFRAPSLLKVKLQEGRQSLKSVDWCGPRHKLLAAYRRLFGRSNGFGRAAGMLYLVCRSVKYWLYLKTRLRIRLWQAGIRSSL